MSVDESHGDRIFSTKHKMFVDESDADLKFSTSHTISV